MSNHKRIVSVLQIMATIISKYLYELVRPASETGISGAGKSVESGKKAAYEFVDEENPSG